MSWDIPPQDATDFNAYTFYKQFPYAIQERVAATNNSYVWPRTSDPWGGGTIGSITETSLTNSEAGEWYDGTNNPPACSGMRWAGYRCPEFPWIQPLYDVVINSEGRDETQIFLSPIASNTKTSLTFATIIDWVTAGYIPSISWLVGKKFAIVYRGGIWWQDRICAYPNDETYWKGSCGESTLTTTKDLDERTAWVDNQFVGFDLLAYGSNGRLQRRSITANDKNTLTFASDAILVGGAFIIVESGGKGFPHKESGLPLLSYGGATANYVTVKPNDVWTDIESLSASPLPVDTVTWDEPIGGTADGCEPAQHLAYDIDVWTPNDAECTTPNYCYSPKLFATTRGLQLAIEGLVGAFVEPKNYDGSTDIHPFSLAEWFKYINCNSFSTSATAVTTTDGSGNPITTVTFSYSVPLRAATLYYDIQQDGKRVAADSTGATGTFVLNVAADKAGKSYTLLGSFGWPRWFPRTFRHAYPRTAYIPDYDIEVDEFGIPQMTIYDPAETADYCCDNEDEPPPECCRDCFGVGQSVGWVRREASTTYKDLDAYQAVVDGGETFVVGELARYDGDNWGDVGVTPRTKFYEAEPITGYWRNLSVMKRRKEEQQTIEDSKRGVVFDGGTYFLTTDKNYWGFPFGVGVGHIESGTATGGSSTTLVDSEVTVTDSDTNQRHCHWQNGNRWNRFILEVDVDTDEYGVPITKKVPITATNPTSGALTFPSYCGLTVTGGKAYRIKEPRWNLNWWEGRTLKITKTDGSTLTTTITHSDNETLFFAPLAEPIQKGWTFEIVELKIGGVYQWNGTHWIEPSGNDPRGQPFHESVFENAPTWVKGYGRACQGDYLTTELIHSMYRGLNALRWTLRGYGWRSRADLAVPESNAAHWPAINWYGSGSEKTWQQHAQDGIVYGGTTHSTTPSRTEGRTLTENQTTPPLVGLFELRDLSTTFK